LLQLDLNKSPAFLLVGGRLASRTKCQPPRRFDLVVRSALFHLVVFIVCTLHILLDNTNADIENNVTLQLVYF